MIRVHFFPNELNMWQSVGTDTSQYKNQIETKFSKFVEECKVSWEDVQ